MLSADQETNCLTPHMRAQNKCGSRKIYWTTTQMRHRGVNWMTPQAALLGSLQSHQTCSSHDKLKLRSGGGRGNWNLIREYTILKWKKVKGKRTVLWSGRVEKFWWGTIGKMRQMKMWKWKIFNECWAVNSTIGDGQLEIKGLSLLSLLFNGLSYDIIVLYNFVKLFTKARNLREWLDIISKAALENLRTVHFMTFIGFAVRRSQEQAEVWAKTQIKSSQFVLSVSKTLLLFRC